MKFPDHKCQLMLMHNEHRNDYKTMEEYIRDDAEGPRDGLLELSEEEQARCIATNEIWTLRWYPDTPISFYFVAAPTLAELLTKANGVDNG